MTKYLLLALSFGRIDRARFAGRFGEPLGERYGAALARACDAGWLREDDDGFAVATFAALPKVRALLYPEAAIAWLESSQGVGEERRREGDPSGLPVASSA